MSGSIAIVLPRKEMFARDRFGAIALVVAGYVQHSAYRATTEVLGMAVESPRDPAVFRAVAPRDRWWRRRNRGFALGVTDHLATAPPRHIDVHNRVEVFALLAARFPKAAVSLWFHNDPQNHARLSNRARAAIDSRSRAPCDLRQRMGAKPLRRRRHGRRGPGHRAAARLRRDRRDPRRKRKIDPLCRTDHRRQRGSAAGASVGARSPRISRLARGDRRRRPRHRQSLPAPRRRHRGAAGRPRDRCRAFSTTKRRWRPSPVPRSPWCRRNGRSPMAVPPPKQWRRAAP